MHRARRAVAAVFFINGVLFANWVTRVPAVKDSVDSGTGALGIALFGIGVGSLLSMPFSGRLCERFGSDRVVTASGLFLAVVLLGPAFAPNVVVLGLTLGFYGVGFGLLDVAMNVQAVGVIKQLARPIMPWFHAAFSFGGLVGAGTGGLAAEADLELAVHFALVGGVMAAVVLWSRPHLLPDPPTPVVPAAPVDTPAVRTPLLQRFTPFVIGLGAIAACAALGEGVMADWSTLFMRDVRDLDAGPAAAGFAAFSVAMTAGRLGGEKAIDRLGTVRVLQVGGSTAALGVLLAVLVPSPVTGVVGFLLVGLGLSCGFPLALSTAGESGEGSGSNEIATVALIGYLGFLVGPPLIGLLAELVGLGPALLAIAVSSAALIFLAPVLAQAQRPQPEAIAVAPARARR